MDIEEDIKILEKFKNNEMQRDKLERDSRCGGWKIGDIYKKLELNIAIDHILAEREEDKKKIKYLEKENEELLEVKISVSAENTIHNLKKENIMLEERCFMAEGNLKTTKEELRDYFYNSIPKQKIKNKIKELENTKGDFATYIAISERIKILKEVLEDK